MIRGLRVPVHLTSRETLRIFDLADIWAARTGNDVRLVSANDHVHTRGSAHYAGLALDFHSSAPDDLCELFRQAGYRVLWNVPGHYAHLHVEKVDPNAFSARYRLASAALRRPAKSRAMAEARVSASDDREAGEPVERLTPRQQARR